MAYLNTLHLNAVADRRRHSASSLVIWAPEGAEPHNRRLSALTCAELRSARDGETVEIDGEQWEVVEAYSLGDVTLWNGAETVAVTVD